MNRENQISETVKKLKQLPDGKLKEVEDFVEFLLSKIDDKIVSDSIQKMTSDSETFSYLKDEEDLYSVNDIKEKYE